MRTFHLYFFAGAIIFSISSFTLTASQSENPALDSLQISQILEKYLVACGGAEALDDIKTEFRKGTLVRGITGRVPFEIRSTAEGKWYYEQVFAWGDRIVYRSDGTFGWIQDTRQVSDIKPDEFLYLRLLLDVHAPLRLREFFPDMILAGSEMTGDKDAVILAAKSPEGLETELYFDIETGLLLRAGDIYFEDYRDAGKVKRPYRIIMGNGADENHLRLSMQITEIKHDQNMDNSYFSEPQCMLAPKDSPIYREWKETEPDTTAMDECVGEYQFAQGYNVNITRERDHLFFKITGGGIKYEIRPASDRDYFMKFNNLSFHFIEDDSGQVNHLELGPDRTRKAVRINVDH